MKEVRMKEEIWRKEILKIKKKYDEEERNVPVKQLKNEVSKKEGKKEGRSLKKINLQINQGKVLWKRKRVLKSFQWKKGI